MARRDKCKICVRFLTFPKHLTICDLLAIFNISLVYLSKEQGPQGPHKLRSLKSLKLVHPPPLETR